MPTLYEITRSIGMAAPSQLEQIRKEISLAQDRHGAPTPKRHEGADPIRAAEDAIRVIADCERQIGSIEALLPPAMGRVSREARANSGWWYLVGALALGSIVILVGQKVF